MSEMIDRVTRAIYTLRHSTHERQARAAIEEMRKPTAAMIDAEPDDYDQRYNKTNSAAHAKAFWQAMIDAALGD